jgi:hypothetical protein
LLADFVYQQHLPDGESPILEHCLVCKIQGNGFEFCGGKNVFDFMIENVFFFAFWVLFAIAGNVIKNII